MLISLRGWYTKALNVTDIILNKMLILPENWNQTALLVFMDMASPTCFLRGIYICKRYFQIYPAISHASVRFNSRWLLPLLLIASPFWNKKRVPVSGPWKTPAYCRAFFFSPLAAIHGDRDTSLPTHGRDTGLGRVQQHTEALLCHAPSSIFPTTSSFTCKAGKPSKGLSYLQALEKRLLDFKMGLNTNLFILFLNFSAHADKEPDPSPSLQVTGWQGWTQSRWAVAGDLSLRCHMTFHKSHCILHCYFTTQSKPDFSIDGIIFSGNKLPFTTCRFFFFWPDLWGSQTQPRGSTTVHFPVGKARALQYLHFLIYERRKK